MFESHVNMHVYVCERKAEDVGSKGQQMAWAILDSHLDADFT